MIAPSPQWFQCGCPVIAGEPPYCAHEAPVLCPAHYKPIERGCARHTALLAALDALVQDMATISGVHGVPHADASEPAMKATAYWQGRLDGLLREHREGPRSP